MIVSWPPSRYPGGHIVVVVGGNQAANTADLVDSSSWDRHTLSVAQFQQWWAALPRCLCQHKTMFVSLSSSLLFIRTRGKERCVCIARM